MMIASCPGTSPPAGAGWGGKGGGSVCWFVLNAGIKKTITDQFSCENGTVDRLASLKWGDLSV